MAEDPRIAKLKTLGSKLDARTREHEEVEPYYEGTCPVPPAIREARVVNSYKHLLSMSQGAWGSIAVDSVLDRLEPSGIKSPDKAADEACWGVWQDNSMDAEAKLALSAALLDGRSHAMVWPDENGNPEVTLDDCTQMVVQYAEGSRRRRVAALRRWVEDDDVARANLYLPDGIHKFRSTSKSWHGWSSQFDWQPMEAEFKKNPWDVVPVVEIRVNSRLKPGAFPYARGEFYKHRGIIDQINLLTYLGLVVAIWMGFPLRGILGGTIGREVLKDDDGNPILDDAGEKQTQTKPPFESRPDSVFQVEGTDVRIAEFKGADRKNLSIFGELAQFAMLTKTPRHYFPQETGISNVSADTIRADEGALHAKVTGHKASAGEGLEDLLRLGGKMLKRPVDLSPRAELQWRDHESRSLAERADAASKLKDVLPPFAVAELALDVTSEQIARWETQGASSALNSLIASANNAVPVG